MSLLQIKKLMERNKAAHKGQSGSVLIVGGSREYVGTVALAGLAALRAGCDIVSVAAPEKVAWAINSLTPDLITYKMKGKYLSPGHVKEVVRISEKFDVVLFGNGISLKSKNFCTRLNRALKSKLKVIDADALRAVSLKETHNAVLTPHQHELEALMNNSGYQRINKIKNRAEKMKEVQKIAGSNVILAKGPSDILVSREQVKKIEGGNPGMAKAGTGDVLAGLCAGFLAQTKDLLKSAESASALNKRIGDMLLKEKKGYSFIASDIVKIDMPGVFGE